MRLMDVLCRASGLMALAALPVCASAFDAKLPPAPPLRPVTDVYFGTAVTDNYRYMEQLDDPLVHDWMKAQADYTRERLDALPGRAALLQRLHELGNTTLRRGLFVRRGQRYFYETYEPGTPVAKLYFRDGLTGQEHLLIDPATLAVGTKTHYALDYFTPSWDGRLIVYGVSAGGSENSVLHVLEVATGRVLDEAIDRTSNSVVSWRPDNRSFFYLRFNAVAPDTPAALSRYNARAYLHSVGVHVDGERDAVVFGRGVDARLDVPEGEGTYVVAAPGSRYAVAVANHNMDRNPTTLYVAPLAAVTGAATPWRKLADVADGVTQFELSGDRLYFLSKRDAPHFRLLSLSLAQPLLGRASVVVPEGAAILTGFSAAREGLYVRLRDGAVSHLHLVSREGRDDRAVPAPYEGNVGGAITDPRESGALFVIQSWVQAPQLLAFDPARADVEDTGLLPQPKVDASQIEAREALATSYDGTRVPISIIFRKGIALDGSHPAILYGYGSYGNSSEPRFDPRLIAWIERGGIYAIAHVRGGGEYGDNWHRGGQMLTKPNTILDFIACGQYLVDQAYTSPHQLAAYGGSAGGITVGGAMTWAPDRFGVILDLVGMSDTLRAETEPNGPPNISEFGSTTTEAGFHGLYAMSAYAHVRDGVAYPAVIFTTGANDPRVAPWHMAKMAARVQAASSSGRPVLLRVDYDAGHGIGSSVAQSEALQADLWSFALWQMGDPAFQPAGDKP
jgi:prolyl oligopeptidase